MLVISLAFESAKCNENSERRKVWKDVQQIRHVLDRKIVHCYEGAEVSQNEREIGRIPSLK